MAFIEVEKSLPGKYQSNKSIIVSRSKKIIGNSPKGLIEFKFNVEIFDFKHGDRLSINYDSDDLNKFMIVKSQSHNAYKLGRFGDRYITIFIREERFKNDFLKNLEQTTYPSYEIIDEKLYLTFEK